MKPSDPMAFQRGDILWIDCDPSRGVEPTKVRTCVVISNDLANRHAAAITVIPTLAYTKARASLPFMVDLRKPRSTMTGARVANASMVMTYDQLRIRKHAGRVAKTTMEAIEEALAFHLGLTSSES